MTGQVPPIATSSHSEGESQAVVKIRFRNGIVTTRA